MTKDEYSHSVSPHCACLPSHVLYLGHYLQLRNTIQSLAKSGFSQDNCHTARHLRDPLPAKRARLTWTDAQRSGVEDQGMATFPHACHRLMEELVQTTLQRPKPKPSKRPYASFLEPKVEGPEQVSPAALLRKRQIGDDDEHQQSWHG
jgi:hypothetical protein